MIQALYPFFVGMSLMVGLSLAALTGAAHANAGTDSGTDSIRRFSLSVGANQGGAERVTLRYALSDAGAFARVMRELGGVLDADGMVLQQPDRSSLQRAFQTLGRRMREAQQGGQRVEFLFYYSGHSDDVGLHLREELLSYRDLRHLVDDLPADVRIGVLDSCASGAMTRLKGGQRRPPFLVDASSAVRGHAFLTSSSLSEAAQESDRIKASFFTHYLVSGLRGAADVNGDGRVTLTEAYRFAFDETLARTEATQAGPQHPTYDIRLAGTGDVVMTDLRETSATLAIAPDVEGRVFIRDEQGRLAAELHKPQGRTIDLGLAPGRYSVTVERPALVTRAELRLSAQARTLLLADALVPQTQELARARGEGQADADATPAYRHRALGFAVLSPHADTNVHITRPDEAVRKARNNIGLSLLYGRVGAVEGLQLGLAVQKVDDSLRGAQVAPFVNLAGGQGQGTQLAAGVNVADQLDGVQGSALVNVANHVRGAQLSLVNATEQLAGVQIGLVNVASGHAQGLQLGLVNYADDAEAQVGLVSLSRKHGVAGQVWASDLGLFSALRFDAAWTHGMLIAGVHPFRDEGYSLGLGVGAHVAPFRDWRVELDGAGYTFQYKFHGVPFDGNRSFILQGRLMLRYIVAPWLSIFAGPEFSAIRPGHKYGAVLRARGKGDGIQLSPGGVLGVQLE